MHDFIVISNRLPVTVQKTDEGLRYSRSNGGLSTAMSSLAIKNQIWIGWPGVASDDLTSEEMEDIRAELKQHNCVPVFLTKEQIELFYEGYANDTLWPLFHYFPSYAKYNETYWQAYQEVNWLFVEAALAHASEKATVWIQDYHLLLAPSMLRTKLPDSHIGLFLHIPFPSYEVFRLLPESTTIIEGMLGADLLGFHIYDYARHFISSATRILGATSEHGIIDHEGHRTHVDAFPIGIDYKQFRQTLKNADCVRESERLTTRYGKQQLILSMDRLDYSKGILKRLEAYERFLSTHPEFHSKVAMHMIAVPSRTEVATYQQLRDTVEQTVARINGQYGTLDWAPISYQFQNLPFHEIVALMSRADIALVTPIRDGMNLVAKEYVASRQHDGVLILSETTGAAEEMIGALVVNPNDIASLARKIHRALTMSKAEQRQRLKIMQKRISEYTVQVWGNDFIKQLEVAGKYQFGARKKRLINAGLTALSATFHDAPSRLVLFDYDGTLHDFSPQIDADAVRPSTTLLRQLKQIASLPRTTVCIISGRPKLVLDSWFTHTPELTLIAEHGAWMKQKGEWSQSAETFDKRKIVALLERFAARTPGAIVEEKDFAVVWHYRRVSPELAYVRNFALHRELTRLVSDSDLVVHKGNKIIEVKPRTITKGAVAKQLAAAHPDALVVCAGDDYTDEDMFKALPDDAATIKIGFGSTHARHQVATVNRMLDVVKRLSEPR